MKKFLGLAVAICLIVPCSLVLSACSMFGKRNFTVNENINSVANEIVEDLINRVYNSNLTSSTTYSVEEIKEQVSDFNYYVEAGTLENVDEVETISLSGSEFKKDDEFYLSVGSNRFIKDKAFFIEEDKLFIAAPIVAFESVNNSKISINGVENNFASTNATTGTFESISFTGTGNTVEEGARKGEWDLTMTNRYDSYLTLFYEGAEASDVVLTRKNEESAISYGLTEVENLDGNPIGYYPIGWGETITESVIEKYDGKTIKYSAYIVGEEKVLTAKLNLTVSQGE